MGYVIMAKVKGVKKAHRYDSAVYGNKSHAEDEIRDMKKQGFFRNYTLKVARISDTEPRQRRNHKPLFSGLFSFKKK